MQVDESSVNSSYGNPQFIRNGEIIYGLVREPRSENCKALTFFFFLFSFFQNVDTKQLPPLNSLLGKYAWVETGIESPCGPQLNEGMTLKLKDTTGQQLVQGEFTLLGRTGMITAVRSSDKGGEDDAPCWEFDLTWNVSDKNQHPSFPTKVSVYVGTVLDDNDAPFLEVVLRNKKADYRSPYGYAKRQADEGDAVGLSDAEKERLNFLTIADYNAVMDTKEAEERKPFDERLLKEKEEQERQEKERQRLMAEQKERNRNTRAGQQEAQREANRKRREEQAGMSKKQRKAANRKFNEEQQAASRERKNAQGRTFANDTRMVTTQPTGKDEKSLIKEEARFDLLKNMSNTASSSETKARTQQAPTMLPSKQGQAPGHLKGFPHPVVKQEEIPPSLRPAVHHGIKRPRPDDPEDEVSKRLKLEY
jgi:hypothetical protein